MSEPLREAELNTAIVNKANEIFDQLTDALKVKLINNYLAKNGLGELGEIVEEEAMNLGGEIKFDGSSKYPYK